MGPIPGAIRQESTTPMHTQHQPVLDTKGLPVTLRREALALWGAYRSHPEVSSIDPERDGAIHVAEVIMGLAGIPDHEDQMPLMEELLELALDVLFPDPPEVEDPTEVLNELGVRAWGRDD